MIDKTQAKLTWKQSIYKLFINDFDVKMKSARRTYNQIIASTNGNVNHFYNMDGEQIRGFYKRPARFTNVLPTHPLVVKYK